VAVDAPATHGAIGEQRAREIVTGTDLHGSVDAGDFNQKGAVRDRAVAELTPAMSVSDPPLPQHRTAPFFVSAGDVVASLNRDRIADPARDYGHGAILLGTVAKLALRVVAPTSHGAVERAAQLR
jgi:hypothetical protein